MKNKRRIPKTLDEAYCPAARRLQSGSMPERLGPYRVLKEIGRGGMGVVYEAEDMRLGRHVGIKLLPEAVADSPEARAALDHEAQLLAALNHPNICTIYALDHEAGQRFLTVELIEGHDLGQITEQEPLQPRHAAEVFLQIARALEAAHGRGIVHCDLKPQNIMITPEGHVKILDFGIARALQADAPVYADEPRVIGTPGYMSPEQLQGQPITTATDLWAFGCLMYECLTGSMAFPGDTLEERSRRALAREVDYDAFPDSVPKSMRELVRESLMHRAGDTNLSAHGICERLAREVNATRRRHFVDVQNSVTSVIENALAVGDPMPAFELQRAGGGTLRSDDLLTRGPLVLVFYRGFW